MPVLPHIVRAPAVLGLNEATRPELVAFGAANLRAENVRQPHQGEAATRYGFKALSGTGTANLTGGLRTVADRDTILRIGTDATGTVAAEVYDAQGGQWTALMGRPSECAMRIVPMPSMGTAVHIEDIAYCNGYFAIAWFVNAGISFYAFAAIVNASTGAIVSAPVQVSSTTNSAALAVVGNSFILVRGNLNAGTVQAHYLDTTSSSTIVTGWVAMADLASDYNIFINAVSVCSLPHATLARAAIAYINSSAGASHVTVKTFTTAGVLETQTIATSSLTPSAIDIQGNALDTLWVAWNETTFVKMRGLAPLAITTTALATTATIVALVGGATFIGIQSSATVGTGRLFVNDGAAVMQSVIRGFKTTAGVAATNGSQSKIYAALACGRPMLRNGRYYIPVFVADKANLQQQVVFVDWTDDVSFLRPIANPSPSLSTLSATGHFRCQTIAGPTAGKFYFGLGILKSAVADATSLVEFDFTSTSRFQPASWGNSLYMTGGLLQYSDGRRIAEVGFLVRPPKPTTSTGSTGITAAVGWRYICVYEEIDSDGNWNVSGLSDPSDSTGAVANKTVTVVTSPLTVSSRISVASAQATSVRVAFYRTLDGGVSPYYRLDSVISDLTAATVSYADTTTDATLASAAKLYSQPGVPGTAQDRRTPPGLSCLVTYNGMLVGASGSDVWYSGQNVSGEGAWFNPVFQVPIPGDGDITALWVMDGALFVAKRDGIYVMAGEAPSDSASSGGLGLPRRLAVDSGAIGPVTCVTSLGTFYVSEQGIELLTRAQTSMWIGQPIQVTLAAYPAVTAMTLDPSNSGSVLVELAAGSSGGVVTGAGRTLVFDLSAQKWIGTDRRTSVSGTVDAPAQSACIISSPDGYRYAWMATNGRVHYEDRTTHLDANGSYVTPLIETGWFNGFQSEQRVYIASLLFQMYTAAGLKVESAYDYGDYQSVDDAVWSEVDTLGERQLEIACRPRGESVKFRITTTAGAVLGTGQGLSVFAMTLNLASEQGPTKGTLRIDPAKRR